MNVLLAEIEIILPQFNFVLFIKFKYLISLFDVHHVKILIKETFNHVILGRIHHIAGFIFIFNLLISFILLFYFTLSRRILVQITFIFRWTSARARRRILWWWFRLNLILGKRPFFRVVIFINSKIYKIYFEFNL